MAGDQLEAFHLPKMRRVSKHVDKEELGYIPMSVGILFVFDGGANLCALFRNYLPLLRRSFARSHRPNEVPATPRQKKSSAGSRHIRWAWEQYNAQLHRESLG